MLDRVDFSSVRECVTFVAERDEIPGRIISGVAAKLLVVDFKVRHSAAGLTAPAIAPQHLLT